MRFLITLSVLITLIGCQAAKMQYFPGTEGSNIGELGWLVTSPTTTILSIDGKKVEDVTFGETVGYVNKWIGVTPGIHTLTLHYNNKASGVYAAGKTDVKIHSLAGKTNYIYGVKAGGINYEQILLDRPANQALIQHIEDRAKVYKMPCPSLPCSD